MDTLRTSTALLACVASSFFACSADAPRDSVEISEASTALTAESAVPTATWSRLLRWGSDLDQAGFHPGADELLAEGPTSIAIGPAGQVLVLDRLNERVLEVSAGETRVAAAVPADSEEIAIGPDGAIAAMSLLRAKVWVYDERGNGVGEVAFPRSFQRVHGVGLDASRRVTLRTSYQETHDLGSPSLPGDLTTMLHSKREGAFFLADGRGLQARLVHSSVGPATVNSASAGSAELLVVEARANLGPAARESERVSQRIAIGEGFSSVRVVGVTGNVACVRLESVTSTPEIAVTRRVRCVDLVSGVAVLDQGLPNPGAYVPRQELAVGAGKVSFMSPSAEGLVVATWAFDGQLDGQEVAQ